MISKMGKNGIAIDLTIIIRYVTLLLGCNKFVINEITDTNFVIHHVWRNIFNEYKGN